MEVIDLLLQRLDPLVALDRIKESNLRPQPVNLLLDEFKPAISIEALLCLSELLHDRGQPGCEGVGMLHDVCHAGGAGEAAFLIVERNFPLGNSGPSLIHDEDPVGRTAVAVLSNHAGQTLTLTRVLVAPAAHGIVCVAAAALAARRTQVPEAVEAALTLGPGDAGPAPALTRRQVALAVLGGLAALARRAAAGTETKVVRLAAVAARPLNSGEAAALTCSVVALGGAVPIAVALAAIFGGDSVAEVPGLATVASVAVGVRQAELATAGYPVAGGGISGVNVAVAKAGLTISTCRNVEFLGLFHLSLFPDPIRIQGFYDQKLEKI